MLKKILWFSALCLVCTEAFAMIFSVAPTDKSMSYLGTIFGGSVGAISLGGALNPTLSKMFQGFNFIIVSMGSVVLGYIGVISTINTAREGEAMGKKLNMWVPMRAVTGLLLMIPTPGTGYSVVQMTVMWVVLNGIGAANSVWNIALQQIASGVQPIGTVSLPLQTTAIYTTIQNLSVQVLYSNTCMAFLNNQNLPQAPFQGTSVSVFAGTPGQVNTSPRNTTKTQTTIVHVGIQGNSAYQDICGSYQVNEAISNCATTSAGCGPNSIQFTDSMVTQRLGIKTQALTSMFAASQAAGQALATGQQPNQGYINAGADAYIAQMANLVGSNAGSSTAPLQNQNVSGGALGTPIGTMSQLGWAHAGSFYFQIVGATNVPITDPDLSGNLPAANPAIADTTGNMPTAGTGSCTWPSWSAQLCNALTPAQRGALFGPMSVATTYQTADRQTPPPSIEGVMSSPNNVTGNAVMDAILNPIFNALNSPVYEFINGLTTSNDDPLKSIATYGHDIMLAAETTMFITMVALVILVFAMSWDSCVSGFANFSTSIGGYIFFLILGLCVMLWSIGATLGVYTPMVPFLIFTTSVFGWFIAVIEAVVAAPVLALGLVHPGGEELGKVGNGLGILANLFLRPTLMIFGFILGANLLRAALHLINFGFMAAVHDALQPTLFSFIPLMTMYAMLVIGIINKSFSLIYVLPNQISRWLGGGTESHEPSELVGKAKEGFDTGAKGASEGMAKGIDTAQSKLGKKKEKMDSDKEKADDRASRAGGNRTPPSLPSA